MLYSPMFDNRICVDSLSIRIQCYRWKTCCSFPIYFLFSLATNYRTLYSFYENFLLELHTTWFEEKKYFISILHNYEVIHCCMMMIQLFHVLTLPLPKYIWQRSIQMISLKLPNCLIESLSPSLVTICDEQFGACERKRIIKQERSCSSCRVVIMEI